MAEPETIFVWTFIAFFVFIGLLWCIGLIMQIRNDYVIEKQRKRIKLEKKQLQAKTEEMQAIYCIPQQVPLLPRDLAVDGFF